MDADRIKNNLKQVVDRTTDQWDESLTDETDGEVGGRRQRASDRPQRHLDGRESDAGPWHSRESKANDRRTRKARSSTDLDLR